MKDIATFGLLLYDNIVEDKAEKTHIPAIEATEEEKRLTARELKDACFHWALEHMRGRNFFNTSINQDIAVSRDGLGEWKTVTKSHEQALSIKLLEDLLKNAVFWKEEQPKKADPNIQKVIYLKQHCRINGNDYRAIITVKVHKSQDYHKYYHHYLDDLR